MTTWPDLTETQRAIGNVTSVDLSELDRCRLASIDRLTSMCVIEVENEVPVVPDAVFTACILMSSRLFSRRNSPEGVAGFGDLGAVRISGTDVDVMDLIAPYRSWGVA